MHSVSEVNYGELDGKTTHTSARSVQVCQHCMQHSLALIDDVIARNKVITQC